MNQLAMFMRVAEIVAECTDWEATTYEAQAPVEWWALDALAACAANDLGKARLLLDTYAGTDWEVRRLYPKEGL